MIGAYGFSSCMRTMSDWRSGSNPEGGFTNASFTINPAAGFASSAFVNSRPCTTGILSVRKYPGVTTRIVAPGICDRGTTAVP